MRAFWAGLALVALLVGCDRDDGASPSAGQPAAQIVFKGGGVYTMSEAVERASALAVRDGVIVAVGADTVVDALVGPDTEVIDLGGKMLLPGFHDAHVHPIMAGKALLGCALHEEYSPEAVLAKVERCAAEDDSEWLIARDFDLSLFPDGNPHKSLLDAILPDRPAFLTASDGHSTWVNSKALELGNITADTPTPPLGVIERDPTTGEPTGTLRETAQNLLDHLLPVSTPEQNAEALAAALAHMRAHGITSFVDAWVGEHDWTAYQALEQSGDLRARVVTSLTFGTFGHHNEEFQRILGRRASYSSELINNDAIKLFVDGVLEGETGALIEPYMGAEPHRGVLNFSEAELDDAVQRFDAMGLQIHMHAIGDLGVRAGLDAIERARANNGPSDNRHHISHLQLIHPDDIARFKQLNVSANFQALWAFPDAYITDINLPAVGPERVNRMYPIGSVHRAGGRIVAGSDWSVSSVDPLAAIETAIRRADAVGDVEGVLNATEAVDLTTMLAAFTRNGAWLMHQDDKTGTLEAGKRADLVLLDQDLYAIPAEQISDTKVLMTVFDGEVVYRAE